MFFVSCGNYGESSFEIASQDSSLSTEELVQAIQSLEMKIEKLTKVMGKRVPAEGIEVSVLEKGIPIKEDSLTRFENTLNRLIDVVRNSSLSSERNANLRRNYEASRHIEPQSLKEIWETEDSARKELFMMTYSQVLEKLGPPEKIDGGADMVQWYYNKNYIQFIDGIVTGVIF